MATPIKPSFFPINLFVKKRVESLCDVVYRQDEWTYIECIVSIWSMICQSLKLITSNNYFAWLNLVSFEC
jgi:hypothetical protein